MYLQCVQKNKIIGQLWKNKNLTEQSHITVYLFFLRVKIWTIIQKCINQHYLKDTSLFLNINQPIVHFIALYVDITIFYIIFARKRAV